MKGFVLADHARAFWISFFTLEQFRLTMNRDITITVVAGMAIGESVTLTQTTSTTIGRHSESDFSVSDLWISRSHFRIDHDGQNWVLTDLNSSHGTLVNDEKVMVKILKSNDMIFAGSTKFCVTFGGDEPRIDSGANRKTGLGNLLRSLSEASMRKTLGDS